MTEVIFKVDIDYRMSNVALKLFLETRNYVLKELGYSVKEANYHLSDKKGHHFWFICECKRKPTPTRHNLIQLLLGDDKGRWLINQTRIERGMPWNDYTNFIFSKVYWRRHKDFSKNKFLQIIKDSDLSKDKKKYCIEYAKNQERICKKFKKILKEGQDSILKN